MFVFHRAAIVCSPFRIEWSSKRHNRLGQLIFTVQMFTTSKNKHAFTQTHSLINREAIEEFICRMNVPLELKIESKLDGSTGVLNVIESVIVRKMQWKTSNKKGNSFISYPKRQYTSSCKRVRP